MIRHARQLSAGLWLAGFCASAGRENGRRLKKEIRAALERTNPDALIDAMDKAANRGRR